MIVRIDFGTQCPIEIGSCVFCILACIAFTLINTCSSNLDVNFRIHMLMNQMYLFFYDIYSENKTEVL